MARPLRIQAPGLTYHVMARGVSRTSIYIDDEDRRRFLSILADVVKQYALRCHAYCQMTNHYHLTFTTSEANLSRALQQLNGDYAQWWNWRHDHAGHLFDGRFKDQVVQDNKYLVNVCRYIVLNPVRAGIVSTPEGWPWSSYRAMIGLEDLPPFLDCNRLLEVLEPDNPAAGVGRFKTFVAEADAESALPRSTILGDDEFVARFQPYRTAASREVPRRDGRRPLEAIFDGPVTRAARNAAIVSAFLERYPVTEIARYLELHPATVSRVVLAAGARPCKK